MWISAHAGDPPSPMRGAWSATGHKQRKSADQELFARVGGFRSVRR